jgi:uncharacterized protein
MPPGPQAAGPVTASERFESLDLLRGVAILGILVMNIYAFAMPFAAYFNPYRMGGDEPWNLATWAVTHVFFDQKFMAIFSMLFGAGIVLMMNRAESRGAAFRPVFFRRQVWLLFIGLGHLVLLWFGDILTFYAIVGMLVYVLRRQTARRLIVIACLMLPVPLFLNYGFSFYLEALAERAPAIEAIVAEGGELSAEDEAVLDQWEASRQFFAPTAEDIEREVSAHTGSYGDALRYRVEHSLPSLVPALPFFILWRVGGLMLLGMALMKAGVLTGERTITFYRRLTLTAYGIGLPLTLFSAWAYFAHDFDAIYGVRWGGIPNYIGSIFVALGHLGLVLLAVKSGFAPALAARFRAVGRMALTNYLMQSVVMTSVFYGYGLGLYGEVPRFAQMLFVAGLITLQLAASPWWLARFRFGPAEWLWRSLTYGRLQPMRLA